MRGLIITVFICLSYLGKGQDITGKWYSEDRTRVYNIYKKDNHFEATLLSSTRKGDKKGFLILQHIAYSDAKKQYEGGIYSTKDSSGTVVKIKCTYKNDNVLRLRLHRFFIMNFNILWYRSEENETAGQ